MNLFRADYFEAWQFVPFLVLASMCTCLNNFLNSVYVVYKRSSSSLVTMLAGAALNLVLNYLFILWFGPVGVTSASFLSLLLVFLLRAYSTRGLLVINFQPGRMLVNLGLIPGRDLGAVLPDRMGGPGDGAHRPGLRPQRPGGAGHRRQAAGHGEGPAAPGLSRAALRGAGTSFHCLLFSGRSFYGGSDCP